MASAGKTSIVEGTRGVHDYEPDTRRSDSGTRDAGRVDGSIHHAVRRTLVRASGGWKEDSPQVREVDRAAPAPRQPAAELVAGAQLRRVRRVAQFARLEQAQVERLLLPSPLQTGSSEDRPAGPALLRLAAHRCEPVAGSGMPLAVVAAALCHSDTATTYKVHLGFFPDDFASDTERLDSWMDLSSPQQATPLIMFLHRSSG